MKKSIPSGKAQKATKKEIKNIAKPAKKVTGKTAAKKAAEKAMPTAKAKPAAKSAIKNKPTTKTKSISKAQPATKAKLTKKPPAKAIAKKATTKLTTKTKPVVKTKLVKNIKGKVPTKTKAQSKVTAKSKVPVKAKPVVKTKSTARKAVPAKKSIPVKKVAAKEVLTNKTTKQPIAKPKSVVKKTSTVVVKKINIEVQKAKTLKPTVKPVIKKAGKKITAKIAPQVATKKTVQPPVTIAKKEILPPAPKTTPTKEIAEKNPKKRNILFEKYNIQTSKLKNMKEKKLSDENTQPVKRVKSEDTDFSTEQKLVALYSLQEIDSQIDKIRTIRGELPMEIQDLEDDVARYETRMKKLTEEANAIENTITARKDAITECKSLIKKYNEQLKSVRNSREFDSINKEVEYQTLEIQLNEKKIKELAIALEKKNADVEVTKIHLTDRTKDLTAKKEELDEIVSETEKEEQFLLEESHQHEQAIDPNLLASYKNIRKNVRNGLAVVLVERDSCGGCFNKIPPQRQMEIKIHKKIIICEYCGRILVDEDIKEQAEAHLK